MVVMGFCFVVGLGLGTLTQWVIDSQIKSYKDANPIPEDFTEQMLAAEVVDDDEEDTRDEVLTQEADAVRDRGSVVVEVGDEDQPSSAAA